MTDDPTTDDPTTDDPPTGKPGNSEAAKYRTQLRDAEAKLAALEQRFTTMQRHEVERLAGHLSQPSAIWAAGVELDQVLDADGNVDPTLATPAIAQAAERLGLARTPGAPRPDLTQGGTGTAPPAENSWTEAMQI